MFRSLALQTIIIIIAFNIVSLFRETSMLSTNNDSPVAQFELTSLQGETVLIDSNGSDTVLYFFAPWCQICHMSIGNLEKIYTGGKEIKVVAIALDFADAREVSEFVSRHNLSFPIALGNEAIKHAFKVSAYPSYYILDGDNRVKSRSMGYSTEIGLYFRTLLASDL